MVLISIVFSLGKQLLLASKISKGGGRKSMVGYVSKPMKTTLLETYIAFGYRDVHKNALQLTAQSAAALRVPSAAFGCSGDN
ncbi:hypothetical protein C84B14_08582 [Salinisphaera sp. C84B14]